MNDDIRTLAGFQRRRLVATLMGILERELWPSLSEPERKAIRRQVLASVDAYHDFILDVCKVYESKRDDASLVNSEAIHLLRRIHSAIQQ